MENLSGGRWCAGECFYEADMREASGGNVVHSHVEVAGWKPEPKMPIRLLPYTHDDAQVMAAARQMYEALQLAPCECDVISEIPYPPKRCSRCAAIAKAEGRS